MSTEPNMVRGNLALERCQVKQMDGEQLIIAEAALPEFGLADSSLSLLQQLVNTSFRVQHKSGNWYMRIYNQQRRDVDEIESELLWVEALAVDGLAVASPRRTVRGSLCWQSPADSHTVCMAAWLDGQIVPGDKRHQGHYAAVGHLLARVHEHSDGWKLPVGFLRPRCDAVGIYGKLNELTRYQPQKLSSQLSVELEEARDALLQAENIIEQDVTTYGLVHGDPSFGNILFNDMRPQLIDFDDSGYGYFVSDLAVVLAGAWNKSGYEENKSAFLDGYQAVRSLAETELNALPLMMAARAASLILWAIESSEDSWIEGQWQRLREYLAAN